MRLDHFLVAQQQVKSRSQAQQLIAAGCISVRLAGSWQVKRKPAFQVPAGAQVRVSETAPTQYASRAGYKLAAALQAWEPPVAGATVLDVGQSTGGFTDCLLQAGAAFVVGIEVGRDQLAPSLRDDARVRCIEGLNARALTPAALAEHAVPVCYDVVVMDLSFISQTLVLPMLPPLLAASGHLMALVKPQFEVGPQGLGKGGIVRDNRLFAEVQQKVCAAAEAAGLRVAGYMASPLDGGDGNREFLMWARKA